MHFTLNCVLQSRLAHTIALLHNLSPPDWYVANIADDSSSPPTEYFIQPVRVAYTTPMTALVTFSGVMQSSSYHTHFRHAALRLIKRHLPIRHRNEVHGCYHNITMGMLPAETILVIFLPTDMHTPQERASLQRNLFRDIGHGIPASDAFQMRNVTLDFFEAVMAIPSNTPLTLPYHLQQQQARGFYHYYSAIQPFKARGR